MAQPSTPHITSPVSIISPQFCAPDPVDLGIVRKLAITNSNFVVTDSNGNILFKVKGKLAFARERCVLIDAAGNPIVTLRSRVMNVMTAHNRWKVFRGESKDSKDLIFSAKRSSMIQLKTKLHVFLANNTKEDVCDFRVEDSCSERSCTIYLGESSTIIAKMHKKRTLQSILIGKDHFMVTVYPNVDVAFVVALIVILDAINYAAKRLRMGCRSLGGVC